MFTYGEINDFGYHNYYFPSGQYFCKPFEYSSQLDEVFKHPNLRSHTQFYTNYRNEDYSFVGHLKHDKLPFGYHKLISNNNI